MAAEKAREDKALAFSRRGEVYLINFDPTVGHEIKKTRPALVIQNDIANRHSPITIVAALTSKFHVPPYPTEVIIQLESGSLPLPSVVLLNQIRSIDRSRLARRLGRARTETMRRVDQALAISVGLADL